jgi:hypothetical protein
LHGEPPGSNPGLAWGGSYEVHRIVVGGRRCRRELWLLEHGRHEDAVVGTAGKPPACRRDVASKNMAEIELSRMALEKAMSPEVKAAGA